MSLYRRNGGSIWWYRFSKDGKHYQASTKTDDKEKAQKIEMQIRAELSSVFRYHRKSDVTPDPGVYFLQSKLVGVIKIGCSANIASRVADIKTANAEELILLASIKTDRYLLVEQILHELFQEQRQRGEWFRITEDDVAFAVKYWERVKDASRVMKMHAGMPIESDLLYTAHDAAHFLNLSIHTIRKWLAAGYLPKVKLGQVVRIKGKVLREFVETHAVAEIGTNPVSSDVVDFVTVPVTNG